MNDQISRSTTGQFHLGTMIIPSPDIAELDNIAHTIQVALTPVFLLTGIGTLISVFSARLAHVADQVEKANEQVAGASDGERAMICHRLERLRRRSVALDAAVILGTVGGAATCVSVLTLFFGALRDGVAASTLYGSFALAISCTVGALCAFTCEVMMSSRLLRLRIAHGERDADLGRLPDGLRSSMTEPRRFGLRP